MITRILTIVRIATIFWRFLKIHHMHYIEIPVCQVHSKTSEFQCFLSIATTSHVGKQSAQHASLKDRPYFNRLRTLMAAITYLKPASSCAPKISSVKLRPSLLKRAFLDGNTATTLCIQRIKNDSVNLNLSHSICMSCASAPFSLTHSSPTGLDQKVAHLPNVSKNVKFNEDILEENTFELEEVLTKATSEENLIPKGMSDMQVVYCNQKFLKGLSECTFGST